MAEPNQGPYDPSTCLMCGAPVGEEHRPTCPRQPVRETFQPPKRLRFPIKDDESVMVYRPSFTVPWAVAEVAYREYQRKWGNSQTMERLAERGGFGRDEFLDLLAGAE